MHGHMCSPTDVYNSMGNMLWPCSFFGYKTGQDAVPVCIMIHSVKKGTRCMLFIGSSCRRGKGRETSVQRDGQGAL